MESVSGRNLNLLRLTLKTSVRLLVESFDTRKKNGGDVMCCDIERHEEPLRGAFINLSFLSQQLSVAEQPAEREQTDMPGLPTKMGVPRVSVHCLLMRFRQQSSRRDLLSLCVNVHTPTEGSFNESLS